MSQIPNNKGDTITRDDVTYILIRPSSPVEGIVGLENLAIWKGHDGNCYQLSLDETHMIQLPDCGDES